MTQPRPAVDEREAAVAGTEDLQVRFSALVDEHHARLCNFIFRYARNRQDAEDLTQDTFLKAYKHFHRYDPGQGTFAAWLYTIARRTLYNHHRDTRPTQELDFEIESQTPSPDRQAERAERGTTVWDEVRKLKSPYREVLMLKYAEGLSVDEIAHMLKRTRTGVKILLFRARNQLRKLSPALLQ